MYVRLPEVVYFPSDAIGRFAQHFVLVFGRESSAHFSLVHYPFHVERVPNSTVDMVQAEHSLDGELCALAAHLDPRARSSIDDTARHMVERVLLLAHGATRHLSKTVRPHELARECRQRFASQTGERVPESLQVYGRRLLAAAIVSSETMLAERPRDFSRRTFAGTEGSGRVALMW